MNVSLVTWVVRVTPACRSPETGGCLDPETGGIVIGRARVLLSRWLVRHTRWPPVGRVRFADLRRLDPVRREAIPGEGRSIEQHYLGRFFNEHATDVRGRVLRVGPLPAPEDSFQAEQCDGDRAVSWEDLERLDDIESAAFDCVLCAGMLEGNIDPTAVVRQLHRGLRPGGRLLLAASGIRRLGTSSEAATDWWRFTSASVERLLGTVFPSERIHVWTYGNVFAATASLMGLTVEDVGVARLDCCDPDYQVLIAARAEKPEVAR